MIDQPNSSELITQQPSTLVDQQPNIAQLQNFEIALLDFLARQNLPTQSVFVEMEERATVFMNVTKVLRGISD